MVKQEGVGIKADTLRHYPPLAGAVGAEGTTGGGRR